MTLGLGRTARPVRITEKQRAAISLAAEGMRAHHTAQALGIPTETVRKRLAAAMRALGARNITHAVAIAIKTGEI